MPAQTTITVSIPGTSQGMASVAEVSIPSGGCAAKVVARELNLPLEQIEAVFVNHQVYSLDHCIEPGDSVAFISTGEKRPGATLFEPRR